MIRMIQNVSSDSAKSYFNDALIKSDYYINDQEMQGHFLGKLAKRIGLSNHVNKEQFYNLCDNVNPMTGKNLTPVTIDNRTVAYDISFHVSKSISIANALSDDDHIIKAFQKAVRETMEDIEADAMTRVRKNGRYEDRQTSELAYAEFIHQTSRPVEGYVADPHLHAHIFCFNCTYDDFEDKIKATQFRYIKSDMPMYEAKFHKRLADELTSLGYQIRKTSKSFEIANIPTEAIELFSKRTNEIGQFAKKHGIYDPSELADLGSRTRAKKQKGISMAELKNSWRKQIRDLNLSDIDRPVRWATPVKEELVTAKDCLVNAKLHSYERASVIRDRRLLEVAYRQAIGRLKVTLSDIDNEFENDQELIKVESYKGYYCTNKNVLAEEREMVSIARKGQGKFRPLYKVAPSLKLEGQQEVAARNVLTTNHQVSIIKGGAGTGKTTLMKETIEKINDLGLRTFVFAPTSEASRGVLVDEGFGNAETTAKLISDKELQKKLNGQVLWCDEAGLLGTKEMLSILKIVNEQKARLILCGDTMQHNSVSRGDALRILNTVGKISTANVDKIYRQKNETYKLAVLDLSKGEVTGAFEKLDSINSIVKVEPLKLNDQLVSDYIANTSTGKSTLIVSPTHQQINAVTEDIRKALKSSGHLSKSEVSIRKLINEGYTEAQKMDWRQYKSKQLVQFNQNLSSIPRGSIWNIKEAKDGTVTIHNDKLGTTRLPIEKASQFDVFNESNLGISKGDKVRITRNCVDKDGCRLNNGHHLEISSISKNGDINLINPKNKATFRINKDFGHIDYGYCTTSHSSQGKTVDSVLISQPSNTFTATNAKQFYVSVSRGRNDVKIYTDDKEGLLDYAKEISDRQSAIELVSSIKSMNEYVHQIERENDLKNHNIIKQENGPLITKVYSKPYEPEI